jgi:dihydroorotate dehydrogenase (NAD+) catalytic subunit
MHSNKTPHWYPDHPPLYDIHKSYLDNAEKGPFFHGPLPKRILPPKEQWIDFLGTKIASPIGVPAGPLLNAQWVSLAGRLGFDVLTYKTIRSGEHPSHPLPNMIYVDTHGILSKESSAGIAISSTSPSPHIEDLAVTNSFGMPSRTPEYLFEDIPLAQRSLQDGQVLIVSIVGTPRRDKSFLEDFVAVAHLAKDAGAQIIEANFSCPNVDKKDGLLYTSADHVKAIGSALVKAIHPIPLIIKVGLFASIDQMRALMITAARSGVRAIAGINTVSMQVRDEKGEPALGPSRLTSGICGGPIRTLALHFTEHAQRINTKEKLGLTLISCGGITLPEHFDQFLQAGADIATSATGMMWDPYLAARYHERHTPMK